MVSHLPRTSRTCMLNLPINEGQGSTAHDSSTYGNNGTIYGATWTKGSYGYGLYFDGTDDYVNCGNDESFDDIVDEITIEAWVKEYSRKATAKLVSRRHGTDANFWFLGIDNGYPYGGIADGSNVGVTSKTFTIPLNEWHHLVFIFKDDENKGYIYYDGVEKVTTTINYGIGNLSGIDVSIGAGGEGTLNYFNGSIAEVLIYNRAWTTDEVLSYYNATKGRFGL